MENEKRFITVLLWLIFISLLISSASVTFAGRQVTQDRKLNRTKIRELYEEQSDKNDWSREEMERALDISRRVEDLFHIYADIYNRGIPPQPHAPKGLESKHEMLPRLIARSFQVCKGYAVVIEEYWEMVNKYYFSINEVNTVFEELPGEIMRHYYFRHRAGGDLSERRRRAREAMGKRDGPPKLRVGSPGNKHAKEEVLGVFRRSNYDMAVVKPYFEHREDMSPRRAWARVEEAARRRIEEEKERQEREQNKEEEERRRRETEAEESRRRVAELLGKDDEEVKEVTPPQERQRGYSLDELLGGTAEQEEDTENEQERNDEEEKEDENEDENEDESDQNEDDDQDAKDAD